MTLPTTVTVDGVVFVHRLQGLMETYEHADGAGGTWLVYRHRSESHERPWVACVSGGDLGERLLNSATFSCGCIVHKDPLYHLDALNPVALLSGVASLVKESRKGAGHDRQGESDDEVDGQAGRGRPGA